MGDFQICISVPLKWFLVLVSNIREVNIKFKRIDVSSNGGENGVNNEQVNNEKTEAMNYGENGIRKWHYRESSKQELIRLGVKFYFKLVLKTLSNIHDGPFCEND